MERTALEEAIESGNAEQVRAALRSGEDPNREDTHGVPALMTAVLLGKPEVVATLLAAGANPNAHVRISKITALMWAGRSYEIARLILEAGADPSASEAHSTARSAIHWAMNGRKTDARTIGLFIRAGADVNSRNYMGETPLYLAARHRRVDLVRMLLEAGADPNMSTAEGYTAWSWSYGMRRTAIRRALLDHGR